MSNLHKAFRKVLHATKFEFEGQRFAQVTWRIVSRENSRSIYTDHLGVTTYCSGTRIQGIAALIPRKPMRTTVLDLTEIKQNSFTQCFYNSLKGTQRSGVVHWFDKNSGTGYIKDTGTSRLFVLYACNAAGADSAYPELVTNVSFESGDAVEFSLGDYHMTKNCGAIRIKKVG